MHKQVNTCNRQFHTTSQIQKRYWAANTHKRKFMENNMSSPQVWISRCSHGTRFGRKSVRFAPISVNGISCRAYVFKWRASDSNSWLCWVLLRLNDCPVAAGLLFNLDVEAQKKKTSATYNRSGECLEFPNIKNTLNIVRLFSNTNVTSSYFWCDFKRCKMAWT